MADTPAEVLQFLKQLTERSRPLARRELQALDSYVRDRLSMYELQAWDLQYVSEKFRQEDYLISTQDLKPYFPIEQVLRDLFELGGRLFGVTIRARLDVEPWDLDARFYELIDTQGDTRGQFYLDLYCRQNKRAGAWMDECVNRRRTDAGVRVPGVFLTCNSSPPVDGKPVLLTHNEVITLFHEFGYGLHHMLIPVDYPSVSGIHGVEWDAVELPSQFMENWCWEREALDLFARHHDSGEPIPDLLYEKLSATRHFNATLQMACQLDLALFDFQIHLKSGSPPAVEIRDTLKDVRSQISVLRATSYVRF